MSNLPLGKKFLCSVVIASSVMVAGLVSAGAAQAAPRTNYSNVGLEIRGGNARALSACVNYASRLARYGRSAQNNACSNVATAIGGAVVVNDVSVAVISPSQ